MINLLFEYKIINIVIFTLYLILTIIFNLTLDISKKLELFKKNKNEFDI